MAKHNARIASQNIFMDTLGDTIVMYIHIPKTGGTSINEAFWRLLPPKDIFMIREFQYDLTKYKTADEAMAALPFIKALSNPNITLTKGKVTYIEVHGPIPPFVQINLLALQQNIRANHGNLFVFTTLRNPLDTARSFKNYLCTYYPTTARRKLCTDPHYALHFSNSQLNHLLGEIIPVPYISQIPSYMNRSQELQDRVIANMHNLDYVGFVENLSETFHVLATFISHSSPGFDPSTLLLNVRANVHHSDANSTLNRNHTIVNASLFAKLEQSQLLDTILYNKFFDKQSSAIEAMDYSKYDLSPPLHLPATAKMKNNASKLSNVTYNVTAPHPLSSPHPSVYSYGTETFSVSSSNIILFFIVLFPVILFVSYYCCGIRVWQRKREEGGARSWKTGEVKKFFLVPVLFCCVLLIIINVTSLG